MTYRFNQVAAFATFILAFILITADAFGLSGSTLPRWQATVKPTSAKIHLGGFISSKRITTIYQSTNGNSDPIKDQREGMSDAFAAFNSLGSIDESTFENTNEDADDTLLMEEIMEDMKGDFSGASSESAIESFDDVDGIGSVVYDEPVLTTEDVTKDILTQDIESDLNVQDFMSSAFKEAMSDVEKVDMGDAGYAAAMAKSVMQDEDFKKEIEEIFDQAAEEMKGEIEIMRKEQAAITEEARNRGILFEDTQKQRLAEAEASVSRLINKVAQETESVQQAMADLERVKREASNSPLEDSALDLKKGGLVKQAALVGAALFGSRALTETILIVGSSSGGDHTMAAIIQGAIALACAAYFFLVK